MYMYSVHTCNYVRAILLHVHVHMHTCTCTCTILNVYILFIALSHELFIFRSLAPPTSAKPLPLLY